MRIAASFILITLSIITNAQEYDLPKMQHYDVSKNYSNSQDAMEFWDNGNVKLDYVDLGDGKKLKREYFDHGKLKLTVEVIQNSIIDTIVYENLTTGEKTTKIYYQFSEIMDGEYIEYKDSPFSSKDTPITFGSYMNNKKNGIWQTFAKKTNHLQVANYNEHGQLEGEYVEYYAFANPENKKIRWIGQFGEMMDCIVLNNMSYGDMEEIFAAQTKKVGDWFLYDKEGNVLLEMNFSK